MSHPRQIQPGERFAPAYVVWELTMRCDHACAHCGSRALRPRANELDTSELLDVADSLVRLGTREVTLIGGEAYLHPGVLPVTERLTAQGIKVSMQTGGRGLTARLAKRCADAGMRAIGVSIDGPQAVHDELRASRGSHAAALTALENAAAAGMEIASNCQVNRLNHELLPETLAPIAARGVSTWRAQLTTPMGRAADRPEWILQPWEVLGVIDTLAQLQSQYAEEGRRAGLHPSQFLDVQLGNNLGYFGPHEAALRSRTGGEVSWYAGCMAGRHVMGIESNGDIKGCPSLPSRPYVGGNVRNVSLDEIWASRELGFARASRVDELHGFCASCTYADICQGGCSFHTTSTFGRRGNNPHCYHRARTLRAEGRRERLVQVERAPGDPYDHGRFEIVLEDWDACSTVGPCPT